MDTNTVKYAIEKFNAAWDHAAPHIQNVSEAYVQYTVTKAVVSAAIVLLLTAIVGKVFSISLKTMLQRKAVRMEDEIFALTFTIGVILTLMILWSGIVLYGAILAAINPEMYTIHQIIKGC